MHLWDDKEQQLYAAVYYFGYVSACFFLMLAIVMIIFMRAVIPAEAGPHPQSCVWYRIEGFRLIRMFQSKPKQKVYRRGYHTRYTLGAVILSTNHSRVTRRN
jgi:hypothetical protein